MARDDPRPRSLGRGTVVQLRLRARLLGVKLLVVDGTVTLTPAEAVDARIVVPAERAERLPAPPVPVPVISARWPAPADASRLEASAQRLDDVARRLRELRPKLS